MKGTIEVTRIAAAGDTVRYEIRDDTGLRLLKGEVVGAWVKYHGAESFGFTFEGLPEQILAVPVTLYLLPVTWFYGVELVVPAADRTLYDALPSIYGAYSGVYGPFREEWRGKVTAGRVVWSEMPASRFDRMVFFSGGIDAVHAGIDNPGAGNVLVSVPSIEGVSRTGNAGGGDFRRGQVAPPPRVFLPHRERTAPRHEQLPLRRLRRQADTAGAGGQVRARQRGVPL